MPYAISCRLILVERKILLRFGLLPGRRSSDRYSLRTGSIGIDFLFFLSGFSFAGCYNPE